MQINSSPGLPNNRYWTSTLWGCPDQAWRSLPQLGAGLWFDSLLRSLGSDLQAGHLGGGLQDWALSTGKAQLLGSFPAFLLPLAARPAQSRGLSPCPQEGFLVSALARDSEETKSQSSALPQMSSVGWGRSWRFVLTTASAHAGFA